MKFVMMIDRWVSTISLASFALDMLIFFHSYFHSTARGPFSSASLDSHQNNEETRYTIILIDLKRLVIQ